LRRRRKRIGTTLPDAGYGTRKRKEKQGERRKEEGGRRNNPRTRTVVLLESCHKRQSVPKGNSEWGKTPRKEKGRCITGANRTSREGGTPGKQIRKGTEPGGGKRQRLPRTSLFQGRIEIWNWQAGKIQEGGRRGGGKEGGGGSYRGFQIKKGDNCVESRGKKNFDSSKRKTGSEWLWGKGAGLTKEKIKGLV